MIRNFLQKIIIVAIIVSSLDASANDFTYKRIADRYHAAALSKKQINEAEMQGECLVGLKELNFKKQKEFDPVAEWTNYRSISLLEQYPPCQVLIMMEVAKKQLKNKSNKDSQ